MRSAWRLTRDPPFSEPGTRAPSAASDPPTAAQHRTRRHDSPSSTCVSPAASGYAVMTCRAPCAMFACASGCCILLAPRGFRESSGSVWERCLRWGRVGAGGASCAETGSARAQQRAFSLRRAVACRVASRFGQDSARDDPNATLARGGFAISRARSRRVIRRSTPVERARNCPAAAASNRRLRALAAARIARLYSGWLVVLCCEWLNYHLLACWRADIPHGPVSPSSTLSQNVGVWCFPARLSCSTRLLLLGSADATLVRVLVLRANRGLALTSTPATASDAARLASLQG